ncbi:MAG: hypothetical protein LBS65_04690 [Desulfovibrio sp.]|nr:hypothetical protein [Desulfovibrio sp.]
MNTILDPKIFRATAEVLFHADNNLFPTGNLEDGDGAVPGASRLSPDEAVEPKAPRLSPEGHFLPNLVR